ncbi:hypothetical protein Tcan_07472 [Toxocara canis]|uniref:Uncharacterized protein n=1 Tax=Toxocara canis TaxID=6265 RepID=A0A0B2VV86_TOXCA|nr:hypothetical protein Tcan_07472 [Toxocara canis]
MSAQAVIVQPFHLPHTFLPPKTDLRFLNSLDPLPLEPWKSPGSRGYIASGHRTTFLNEFLRLCCAYDYAHYHSECTILLSCGNTKGGDRYDKRSNACEKCGRKQNRYIRDFSLE